MRRPLGVDGLLQVHSSFMRHRVQHSGSSLDVVTCGHACTTTSGPVSLVEALLRRLKQATSDHVHEIMKNMDGGDNNDLK